MKFLRVVLVVVLVGIGAGAVYIAIAGPTIGQTETTQYLTANVARRDVTADVAADGHVSASRTWSLQFGSAATSSSDSSSSSTSSASSSSSSSNSSTSGGSATWQVTKVDVAVGDRVTKGKLLAKATSADLQQQLSVANSQLRAANIQLDQAETALTDAAGTDAEDQARVSLYQARANASNAQATVTDLKAQLAKTSLVAPAAGVVTAVNVQAGADASGTAVTIEATPLQVVADVTESDLPSLTIGQPASITISAVSATVDGTVTAIAPTAASSSSSVVTYEVTVELTNPPDAVRAGMSAQVAVTTASATNVLAVPVAALQGSNGSYEVRVVDAAGAATARAVSVGLVTDRYAEITNGLSEGDRVIIGTASQQQTTTGTGGGLGFPIGGGGGGNFPRGGNGGNGGNGQGGGQVTNP